MLKVRDTIKCKDPEDMVDTMFKLHHEGYDTEFMYEKDGERGLWLVIQKTS